MSSINNVRDLRILCFSKKNKNIRNLKNGEKKWPDMAVINTTQNDNKIKPSINLKYRNDQFLYHSGVNCSIVSG